MVAAVGVGVGEVGDHGDRLTTRTDDRVDGLLERSRVGPVAGPKGAGGDGDAAPSAARRCAIPDPIPRLAPVTSATLPRHARPTAPVSCKKQMFSVQELRSRRPPTR